MNWGTKIVLGMIAFMLFIIGMVIYMFKVHDNDALVENDYYEKGINYDQEYTAKKNTFDENATPDVKITEHQLVIALKEAADYKVLLLRPSSAKMDVRLQGRTLGAENLIIMDTDSLAQGLWSLNVSWKVNGKDYSYKKNITL